MRKYLIKLLVLSTIFCSINTSFAAGDPVQMLSKLADTTLTEIHTYNVEIKKDKKVLYKILEQTIIPHVDFNEMALWIAGKSSWRGASEKERNEFISEFKILVLRTYSHFLLGVSDEKLTFKPNRHSNGKRLQVSGTIIRSNGEVIDIDYRLVDVGQWKIYDVVVQGVSLLKGFQAQFSDKIRKKGLTIVIQEIAEHNNQR
ncbi:MAG: ABC transporter substrate-binding protein [Francisellaceae bacterium]|nr:ABC transporter substrate-binding protein [Francisellaceae bacterium]MBT6539458.1 ABC transporter substrate-binding protein [Francisellaceae bacterium]